MSETSYNEYKNSCIEKGISPLLEWQFDILMDFYKKGFKKSIIEFEENVKLFKEGRLN